MRRKALLCLLAAFAVFAAGAGDIRHNSGWPSNVYGSSMIVNGQSPFDITKDLILHFPLDDGSGSTARDLSGNGYDGSLIQGASFTSDYVNLGGSAPGDMISIPDGATIAGQTGVTVALCGYYSAADSNNVQMYVEDTSTIGFVRFALRIETDESLLLRWRDAAGDPAGAANSIFHSITPSAGTWYFIAGRVDSDADVAGLFLDADEEDWAGGAFGAFGSSATAVIGLGDYTDGPTRKTARAKKVRVFSRYLDDAEMTALRLQMNCAG